MVEAWHIDFVAPSRASFKELANFAIKGSGLATWTGDVRLQQRRPCLTLPCTMTLGVYMRTETPVERFGLLRSERFFYILFLFFLLNHF